MDATELLKEDHETVRDLLKKYEAAGDRAYQTKKGLFEEIRDELEIHSEIEEKIFYPAVKRLRSADAEEIVDEAIEEHAIVKRLLEELDGLKPQDERFDAKMKVLKENVEHHAGEEEDEMFPEARSGMDEARLEELGSELAEMKETLKSRFAVR
ncbi:MAG TPA: hemerythrin domain-containing protein [Thermoanaerobaculia bacterium]|nr:hemerythrin domain-containing protein [Thermoanaerobaculia bacterium]